LVAAGLSSQLNAAATKQLALAMQREAAVVSDLLLDRA
jgi:hypothetical protein